MMTSVIASEVVGNAVVPAKSKVKKVAAVKPFKRLISTIDVDGRDFQVVTEWWSKQVDATAKIDPEFPNRWVTQRIYDPFAKAYYSPSVN